jgi:hypothetical protein
MGWLRTLFKWNTPDSIRENAWAVYRASFSAVQQSLYLLICKGTMTKECRFIS